MSLLMEPKFVTQLSSRNLILLPLLAINFEPVMHVPLPCMIHFQVLEAILLSLLKHLLWHYFEYKILDQMVLEFLKSLHARDVWRTLFLISLFYIPNPSSFYPCVMVFQPTMCIFFFSVIIPYMKFLTVLLMVSLTFAGNWMYCMTWKRMLLREDFAGTVLLVILGNFVFHPFSLFFILSTMN